MMCSLFPVGRTLLNRHLQCHHLQHGLPSRRSTPAHRPARLKGGFATLAHVIAPHLHFVPLVHPLSYLVGDSAGIRVDHCSHPTPKMTLTDLTYNGWLPSMLLEAVSVNLCVKWKIERLLIHTQSRVSTWEDATNPLYLLVQFSNPLQKFYNCHYRSQK